MPQTKPYKVYYTASEVKAKLGITDGQLYNYVRYGHLERVIPPGRKQGVFKREEVDKFALEMQTFLSGNTEAKRFTFTNVTARDVPENVKVTQSVFGNNTGITVAKRTAWVEKNSDVSYQLCIDGAVIGCGTILPLRPERIEQILRGEVNSEDTTPDEIEVYEPGRTYHLYVMGLCVSPLLSKQEKRLYGAKLVRGLSEVIINLGKSGIEVETITARSMMFDGVRILRHLGFTQIPSITNNVNFRIEVDKADNVPLIQDYKRVLKEQQKTRRSKTKEHVKALT